MAFKWPLKSIKITNGFGKPGPYAQYGPHNGIDLAAPTGTAVYAADAGTIKFEGWGQKHSWMTTPAGICILQHVGGSYAGYAHLSRTVVNKGQKVKKGQLIGYVGATGAATGPHLHFEMLPLNPNFSNGYGGRINPMPYIEQEKLATQAQIKKAYLDILERKADADGLRHYSNYTIEFVKSDLKKSSEKRKLDAKKAKAAKAAADKKAAEAKKAADRKKAEEAAAKKEAEEAAESQSNLAKENNALLKQILSLLTDLFNKFTSIFK